MHLLCCLRFLLTLVCAPLPPGRAGVALSGTFLSLLLDCPHLPWLGLTFQPWLAGLGEGCGSQGSRWVVVYLGVAAFD